MSPEIVNEFLAVAVKIAPDGPTQEALGRMVNEMRGAGKPEKDIFTELAETVLDGMHWGNWGA